MPTFTSKCFGIKKQLQYSDLMILFSYLSDRMANYLLWVRQMGRPPIESGQTKSESDWALYRISNYEEKKMKNVNHKILVAL